MYIMFNKDGVFSGITDKIAPDSNCNFIQISDEICNNILANLDKKIIYEQGKIKLYQVTDEGETLFTNIDVD